MITEEEFKELFKLSDECVIPKDTIEKFVKQITGAYQLYKEVQDVRKVKFTNIDGTPLRATFVPDGNHGFQSFVYTLGSKCKFHVSYVDKDGKGTTPFWTYTKYKGGEVNTMKNSAYRIFISQVLMKLRAKYSSYGFTIDYRDLATSEPYRCHPNQSIWWDGIIFESLYFQKGKKYLEISNYTIEQVISQRSNVWNGRMHKTVQKIIDHAKTTLNAIT